MEIPSDKVQLSRLARRRLMMVVTHLPGLKSGVHDDDDDDGNDVALHDCGKVTSDEQFLPGLVCWIAFAGH